MKTWAIQWDAEEFQDELDFLAWLKRRPALPDALFRYLTAIAERASGSE